MHADLSWSAIVRRAVPVVLANIAAPLLGLVDTAVIGRTGSAVDLGAIALGAMIFNFLYWGLGFLRMSTTGIVAQADGAGDLREVRTIVQRGLLLALCAGLALVAASGPLRVAALGLFSASEAVEAGADAYLRIRLLGAPAALALFVVSGLFIGCGRTGELLRIQLMLGLVNAVLDVLLAGVLGWGVAGIAAGTAVAEYLVLAIALRRALRLLGGRSADWPRWAEVFAAAAVRRLLRANGDLLVRTVLLLACFAYFTNAGARFGDAVLAANHVLLQFVSFSACLLDGFAFVAEAAVGRAIGGGNRMALRLAIRRTSLLSALTALALAVGLMAAGEAVIALLTELAQLQALAARYLPWCALYVALSFGAFQLDGVFIGAMAPAPMRNAQLMSAAGFLALAWWLVPAAGNDGLWGAFCGYVVLRALSLGVLLPGLLGSPGRRLP